jgi:hypothetical protein
MAAFEAHAGCAPDWRRAEISVDAPSNFTATPSGSRISLTLKICIALNQSAIRGAATLFSSFLLPAFAFSFRRSIRRAAFFCCFSFRAHAFCRFLKVSIGSP